MKHIYDTCGNIIKNIGLAPNQLDIFSIFRSIALLCVFGIHAVIVIGLYVPQGFKFPSFLYTPAWAAMWMFFGLSGLLLGRRFYNGQCDTCKQIKNFYISRFFRIVLPYYLFIFIFLLFINPVGFWGLGPKTFLRLLTFTYNGAPGLDGIGATWFISTIVQLYLVTPFIYHGILKKIPQKYTWLAMLILLLLGFSIRQILNKYADWYTWTYTFSPMQWDIFFIPFMLNAYTQKIVDLNIVVKKYLQIATPLLLLIALFCCHNFIYINKHISSYRFKWPSIFIILMVLLGIAYGKNRKDKPVAIDLSLKHLLKNPLHLLEAFSWITFSFYLYHSNILGVIPRILQPYNISRNLYLWLTVGGGFCLSLIWACILYACVERPLNKFRSRYADKEKIKFSTKS